MTAYTLTKESMLQYLNRAIAEVTKQITEEQAKLESAQTAFKVTLDELYRDLYYELHDPEATVIKNITEKALKEFKQDFAYKPITKWFYFITNSAIYNGTIGEHILVRNPKNCIIEEVKKELNNNLKYASDCLLDTDNNVYNFNWYNDNITNCCNKVKEKLLDCHKKAGLVNQIKSNIKSLTRKITLLQRELTIAEFCESVTFQLTSECKL